MFKTKRTEFIVLTVALLVTRAVDAGLTFLITPDLSREQNPNLQTNRGWRILVYVFAYSLPRTTILWGLLIIFHNTLGYLENPAYQSLRESFNVIPIYYMILPLLGLIFIDRLLIREYARYKTMRGETREHTQ